MSEQVVLASGNAGKLAEFRALLGDSGLAPVAQTALGISSPEETGLTFVENAIIKARHAATASGLPAIADDSGLEVDYLSGRPGIHSARFSGPRASDEDNNDKLLALLDGVPLPLRTARYHCVIVYLRHGADPVPLLCQGSWEGVIALAPRGSGGFGYDPLFLLPSLGKTAAELAPPEKNLVSHRGIAMARLREVLAGRGRETTRA